MRMGCSSSTQLDQVVETGNSNENEEDKEESAWMSKSQNSSFVSLNASIESDLVTVYSGAEIMAPHRSISVDFGRTFASTRDHLPVATATIIRGAPLDAPLNNGQNVLLPHRTSEIPSSLGGVHDITLTPPHIPTSNLLLGRRASEGDIGKVTDVTCIPRSLLRSNEEEPKKMRSFGPRNSHLTITESQKDFFRMLDEKVAQGRDYSSEDEKSLASFRSFQRKDSNGSNGIMRSSISQRAR